MVDHIAVVMVEEDMVVVAPSNVKSATSMDMMPEFVCITSKGTMYHLLPLLKVLKTTRTHLPSYRLQIPQ